MGKNSLQDLQRLNPQNIESTDSAWASLANFLLNPENVKRRLAEKVISGKKLTKPDKEDIYRFLTGEEPLRTKKGRPTTNLRDMYLAVEYLTLSAKGQRLKNKIRDDLVKQYGLSARENTFYIALNRGIRTLKRNSEQWINDVKKGYVENTDEHKLFTSDAETFLQLIADFRNK